MKHFDTRDFDLVRDSADPVIRIHVAEDSAPDQIVIPDAQLLVSAKFKKIGSDLTLTGTDGKTVVVEGYFDLLKRPELVAPGGGGLSADVVERLAVSQTAGQYAQVGAPAGAIAIGRVERVGGSATVQHANGTVSELNVGDVVYQGDVVETRDGSQLGISFSDGTAFNLGTNARMVLSELIYSPGGQSNGGVFNLVKGTMTFVAGQVAKSGDMRVVTPVSTMGIRGTTAQIAVSTDAFGNTISVVYSLMADPDGNIGFFDILDSTGIVIGTVRTTDSTVIVTPAANLTLLAQTVQKTPEIIQAELAVAQVLFPIFLSNPANFIQTPQQQDLQPKGASPIGSSEALTLPPQGVDPSAPTQTITETISGTISPSPPPGSPPGTPKPADIVISEQTPEVKVPVNLLPLINIDTSNNLVEAAGANSGVATSSAPIIKSDLNQGDTVSYDTAALTADKWDNLGNGIFGKLGSYGAVALNTTGVAAAALLAAGWLNVGAGIFEKTVVLHDANGNPFNETVRVNSAANSLTYALDNAKADPLAGGSVVTEKFVVPVVDNHGGQNHNVATFTVEGTNDAATLSADISHLTEGNAASDISTSGKLTISDVDSAQTFKVQTDTAGLYGKFSIGADGSWTYTANGAHKEFAAGVTYTDTFEVLSADGTATSVTIHVLGTNEPPVANDDTYSVALGHTLHVPANGVLGNDYDADGEPLSASLQHVSYHGENAATLSLLGGTAGKLTWDFNPSGWSNPDGIGVGSDIRMFDNHSPSGQGLRLSGPSLVTFTFLGSEALYTIGANFDGQNLFFNHGTAVGTTIGSMNADDGLLEFLFRIATTGKDAVNGGPIDPSVLLGLAVVGSDRAYAFLDDSNPGDRDFDDMVIRIDVHPTVETSDGLLTFNSDGSFDFKPFFAGTATFTYKVNDGSTDSPSTATVTIDVPTGPETLDISSSGVNTKVVLSDTPGASYLSTATTAHQTLANGIKNVTGGLGDDTITGTNSGGILNGGSGRDAITGGAGNDVLIGGSGDDQLRGGGGDDYFVFRSGFGHDRVADFNVGDSLHHDMLDLRGLGFASIQAVLDATDAGPDAVIHVGANDITLAAVTKAMLESHTSTILI